MNSSKRQHIVIVGGGFGGIAAARKLRRADADVTLIDKTNHHLFQPLLYQVATAALSPGDIAEPIRAITGRYSNTKVLMGEVEKVQPEQKLVRLVDGRRITYDRLILAPGAHYNYFGHDEWKQYAPALKSLGDSLQVRERILISLEEAEQTEDPVLRKPYLTYVVIGGGPTGVEMAGAISEITKRHMMGDFKNIRPNEVRIFLVEAEPNILNGYPDSLSEKGRLMLENMGVQVLLNSPVTDISENRVSFKSGSSVESLVTPNIIWAAGVLASPLFDSLNVEQDRSGRVKVHPDLRVPEYPDIFVIGDAACVEDDQGKPLPALAPVAKQQGEFVGNLLRKGGNKSEILSIFRYVDRGTMTAIGRAKAVANIRGLKFSGFVAWLLWSVVHIFFLIGYRNRFRVFIEWVWYYFTFKRGVRLIITDRPKCRH